MNFIGLGTVANVATIVLGSLLGLAVGSRLPSRTASAVTESLGLVTLVIAALSLRPLLQPTLNDAVGGAALIIIMLAVISGTMTGSLLRLEDRMEDLGRWVRRKLARGSGDQSSTFVEGFVTSSLVFCVGPMAVLGSLQDGLGMGADQLLAKSLLDGFAAIAFASSLGIGVLASAIPVGLYQGALTLLGFLLGDVMPPVQVDALTVAGGIVLMALSFRLIGLKHLRVADMLPALLFAPVFVWCFQLLT
ncbi:DUF554 domain-containing protein [Luteococcus sp. Sow4_B9]|uniref:DUF554 domain-containing protein n=1 Tax=Luteococcus sp. Sow4_B9 TaxID=3438792 RepID=UPI003F9702FE